MRIAYWYPIIVIATILVCLILGLYIRVFPVGVADSTFEPGLEREVQAWDAWEKVGDSEIDRYFPEPVLEKRKGHFRWLFHDMTLEQLKLKSGKMELYPGWLEVGFRKDRIVEAYAAIAIMMIMALALVHHIEYKGPKAISKG